MAPIFAELLRPLVQDHYEVQTDVPVGDAPREADIVLLRRTSDGTPPFQGLWRHLSPWNILEFKGPTVDPRLRDLDLLVELGLGIDRRLNEDRERLQQPQLARPEVSFWYLANHLGQRFLAEAERLLGSPTSLGEGLWRFQSLERPVFLVSRDVLPLERESVPLHLVTREAPDRELALAREVVAQPGFWELYGAWLAYLHPGIWEEVQQMARASGTEPTLDLRPLIEKVGVKQVLDQIGVQQVVAALDQIGVQQVVAALDLATLASQLNPEQRRELKRLLQQED